MGLLPESETGYPLDSGTRLAVKLDCFLVQLSLMNQTAKMLRKIRLWGK